MAMDVKNKDPLAAVATSDPSLEPGASAQTPSDKALHALQERIAQRRKFEAIWNQDGLGSTEELAPLSQTQTQVGTEQSDWNLSPETLRAVAQDANAPVALPPPAAGVHAPTSTQARQLLKKMATFQPASPQVAAGAGNTVGNAQSQTAPTDAVTSKAQTSKKQKDLSPEEAELEASKQELMDVIQNRVSLNSSEVVNWQAFFNLLSIKNMKLIQEMLKKQHEIQKLEATNANLGMVLSRESKQFNVDMGRVESVMGFASQFPNLHEAITGGPFRRLINAHRLLEPDQLDLVGATKNATMQGPVQDTYRRSYIHHMAGDEENKPLIADPTHSNKTRIYIPRDTDTGARDRYRNHNDNIAPTQKILTSYVDKDGKTVPLDRTWLSASEIQGLRPNDKTNYEANIMPIHRLMRIDDLMGRLGLLQHEVACLENAAAKARDPQQQALLRQRANEIRPEMQQAQRVALENINFVGHDEDRFSDLMRKRGELEELREQANSILEKDQKIHLQRNDGTQEPHLQETIKARIELYKQTKRTLDWRATNLDEALRLFKDSHKDNRRGRFYSGAHGPVDFYLTHQQGLDALRVQEKQRALTTEEQHQLREHQHALGMLKLNAPDYLFGANALNYKLNELLKATEGGDGRLNAGQIQELRELVRQYPSVSRDRMIHHVRLRKAHLESQPSHGKYKVFSPFEDLQKQQRGLPETDVTGREKLQKRIDAYETEKAHIQHAEDFWQKTDLWEAKKPAGKTRMIFNLRQELHQSSRQPRADAPTEQQGAQAPLFSEKPMWLDEHGRPTEAVNLDHPQDIARHSDLSSGAGAAVFSNPRSHDHGAGAYQNKFFDKMSTGHSVLQYLVGNPIIQSDGGDMAQSMAESASGDAQEAMQQMTQILTEGQQRAQALVERMLQRANEAIR